MSKPDDISIKRQIDQICDEFEESWNPEVRPNFDSYLQRIDDDHRQQLLEALLAIDLELRVNAGQETSSDEYRELGEQAVSIIDKLLGSHDGGTVSIKPGNDPGQTIDLPPADVATPMNIGPYKLLQQLGEGGMGTVWMAEQEKPVRRRVAVKIIKAGMDSGQVIARFEAERQALAMMDHANIAKVFDGGTTENGRPYFVMELVHGTPITQFCDSQKLGVDERLELFRQVCDAVQHAHQKGIIHRDLKPSNILVALQNDVPIPKVIDFGLAKATGQQLTEKTMFTAHGQVLGTLEYMSPEQANLNDLDVDTRSDIYSLGVVLYELLTGTTPLSRVSLRKAAFMEVIKRIKEEEPERPSSRIGESSDSLESISADRQIEPRKLTSIMKGELDWLVMKAIDKDRTRRYETVNGLAADVSRYLANEPVTARPPSLAYRLRKSYQRQRPKYLLAATALALLTVSIIFFRSYSARLEFQSTQEITRVTVDSLAETSGLGVPLVLKDLDELPRDLVLEELQVRFTEANGQRKLNLAYGLAQLGQVEVEVIVGGVLDQNTKGEEMRNVVAALRGTEEKLMPTLKSAAIDATEKQDWGLKTRLAVVAMYFDDSSIAEKMLKIAPEILEIEPGKKNYYQKQLPNLLGDFAMQLETISEMPDEDRNSWNERQNFATACYYLDRNEEALSEFQKLAGESANDVYLWSKYGFCLAREGRAEDAAKAVTKLAAVTSEKSSVAYAEILVQGWLGNLDEASLQLEELVASDWENAQILAARASAQLARVCQTRGLPEEKRFKTTALQLLRTYDLGQHVLKEAPDFIPLHSDAEFQALLTPELVVPANPWDPVQRTTFIAEFPQWCGDTKLIAESSGRSNIPHFRSGLCLALGGVDQPEQESKDAWKGTLENWYTESPEGGSHSAARWALTQWKLDLPLVNETQAPVEGRNWWHAPGLRFLKIPAGTVQGEGQFSVPIAITDDFWLSDCEITVGLFQRFKDDDSYTGIKPEYWHGAQVFAGDESRDLPVQRVSWFDSVMFCNWLSRQLDLDPYYEIEKAKKDVNGYQQYTVKLLPTDGVRLPSEAEWEYSCRALTTTKFSFGDNKNDLIEYGWFDWNSNSRTQRVATKRCNAWGLFDMHGNVSEWCWDLHPRNDSRMFRGGSWDDATKLCPSSQRLGFGPEIRFGSTGFRVARGPSSPASESESEGR